ncbi:MAG: hypothetical protein RI946_1821 [Pseudomonadota bacterium]
MGFLRFLGDNKTWIGAGFLLSFLSSFGQTYFISIFSGEIRTAFDLTHAQWGSIYGIGTFSSAVVMIWAGGLSDIIRTRVLGAIVLGALACAVVFMSQLSSYLALPFAIFFLRFFGQGMAVHLSTVAMSRWFVAARGRALSIANLGYSLGEALLPMTMVALMGFYAWQTLWLGASVLILAMIPVLFLLLHNERTPQSMAEENSSLGMGGRHWTRKDTLRHPLFWFMMPAMIGPGAFFTAFFFQQVPFAAEKGWSHLELVKLFPIYSVSVVAANLVSGWALDKWGVGRLIPYFQLPLVVAFIVVGQAQDVTMIALALVLLGLVGGANSTLPNAFWAEFYGTRHLGAIKALATAIMVLGSAIGPAITGFGLGLEIPLSTQFQYVAAYFACTSIAMMVGVLRFGRATPITR